MSFFTELKRRNVFRVAAAYVVSAWLLIEVGNTLEETLRLPEWADTLLAFFLIIGFPIALFISWAYEITPGGIKRETEVEIDASSRSATARKLNQLTVTVMALALVYFALDKWVFTGDTNAPPQPEVVSAQPQEATPAQAETEVPEAADETPSVAVLPFATMSPDPDNEYFADGVAEEILNILVSIDGLKVAARTSSFAFKGSSLGISEIAGQLGVTHILEGSVRKTGTQVRVTAQLIQAKDGFHLWSKNFDRQLVNIFEIQDEIAASIASVLEAQLLSRDRSYTRIEDLSPEIYEKFLKARFLLRRRNMTDIDDSIVLLREVTESAPDFPRGLALLSEALTTRLNAASLGYADNVDYRSEIESLVRRSLELEPELALAHLVDAYLAIRDNDPLKVIRKMQRAVELDPSEPRPHHWLAVRYTIAGYLDRAMAEAQKAVELDPENANTHFSLGINEFLRGNLESAEERFLKTYRLGNPAGASAAVGAIVLSGDLDRARALVDTLSWPSSTVSEMTLRFIDAAEDESQIPDFLAYLDQHPKLRAGATYELMALGQYELAIEHANALGSAIWSEKWAEARSLPAFEKHVGESRLAEVWDALGTPPACQKINGEYDCSPEAMAP